MSAVYERAIVAGGLLIWALGGLVFSLAAILTVILRPRSAVSIGRGLLRRTVRFFLDYLAATRLIRMEFSDLELVAQQAAQTGAPPLIIAPNHPSLLAAVFIMAYVPNVALHHEGFPVAEPVLARRCSPAGFIRNDSPRSMVEQSIAALRSGSNLLIFPEGTRTGSDVAGVGEFKGGVALIARVSGMQVQPDYFTTSSGYLSKGWPVHRLPQFPLGYSARVGEPLGLAPQEKGRSFLERMEDHYRRQLQSASAQ
jgi:1-acyl-sn-glycerol-3-phosphate acyltransferase